MKFKIISSWGMAYEKNVILLKLDNWDDFGYKTTFHASYYDNTGIGHELGTVKIAITESICGGDGSNHSHRTSDYLENEFKELPDTFYSLWQTAEAYKRVLECEKICGFKILKALNDISYDTGIYEKFKDEEPLNKSLFRSVSLSLYINQFRRIARGDAILTPYNFLYEIENDNSKGKFKYEETHDIYAGSFENTICISFNPFDEYSEVEKIRENFSYIGIKKEYEKDDGSENVDGYVNLNLLDDIQRTFMESLKNCLKDLIKKGDLRETLETFGTNLGVLTNIIFGYEVKRTGFNRLLKKAVDKYNDYESVLAEFSNQLGDEAKSIVRIMLKQKEIR